MRVHRLEVTAFGPFAGTEVIDFGPLNDAGVFLLTGHTGAGKTSILDAICFGLYGAVPGVRDKAKSYRSHHAPEDRAPLVVLEVTLQGRRLRITRHPAWSRPSTRARSGAVEEKARATVEERVGGSWVARSSRADEVGHFVTGLIGLNRDQFCQVVMLAQGEFQTFLRAGGAERQKILESLFGTQRFQAVERWLVEHRREQSRRYQARVDALDIVTARLQEVCSPVTTADDFALPTTASGDCPRLLVAARELATAGERAVRVAAQRLDETMNDSKHTQHAYDEARSTADLRRRYGDAQRRYEELVAADDLVASREHELALARAAEGLLPFVELSGAATAALARATRTVDRVRGGLADISTNGELAAVIKGLDGRVALLQELSSVEQDGDVAQRSMDEATAERIRVGVRLTAVRARLEDVPKRTDDLRQRLDAATSAVAAAAAARRRHPGAELVLSAAVESEALDLQCAALARRRQDEQEATFRLTDVWLKAKEHMLEGVAAELAGRLVEGECCPVCGSDQHPSPAAPTQAHVSAQQESELYAQVDASRQRLRAIELLADDNRVAREHAFTRSQGRSTDEARLIVDDIDAALAAAAGADEKVTALMTQLREVGTAAATDRVTLHELLGDQARLHERVVVLRERIEAGLDRIVAEVGPERRIAPALEVARRQLRRCRTLETAVQEQCHVARAADQASARLATALEDTGFSSSADVLAAALSAPQAATLDSLNRAHAADVEACRRALHDPVLEAAAAGSPPDLTTLEAAALSARIAAAEASGIATAVQRRQTRLEQLLEELAASAAELEPQRAAKELADSVAGLCAGSAADNVTRTALSHYVLASRLTQVVAAANARLAGICSGRYQLGHTLTRGAGDTRGGLGLVVHDAHTDRARDPATLSGGETFYVSLSLALGLADVVTGEAGGVELSTLFVDEGFGGLDDDTREEVLDELDALRSGGRTIGLVSHLSELRARIPAQLHVVAGPHGSACRPVADAGSG